MRSLELRLAAVKKTTATLITQLSELIRLRDRLRKAELARRSPRIERRQRETRRYHQKACTSLAAPGTDADKKGWRH
jgi:hypothetical protein